MKTSAPVAVGAVVEFRTPQAVRAHLAGQFEYLLKPIAAGPGDTVDTTGGAVVINSVVVPHSAMLAHDSQGRAVDAWRAKRVLGADEFFVLSTRIPNSLDSRYFGPIHRSQIESVRRCVWAFE
jgi:conjugative transfer signal peptidase TraF